MTPDVIALKRTARTMPFPKRDGGLTLSLLLHAAGITGLLVVANTAPKSLPPAAVIELIAAPRPPQPAPPAIPIPPPRNPAPKPARPPIKQAPAPPLPQPESAPPATVRDETAIAQADTLAMPTDDSTVTITLPMSAPAMVPGNRGSDAGKGGTGLKGKLVSVTRLARMPVLTVASKPEYTAEMRKRNLAGKLRAKVLVDSDGKVKEALVLADLGYGTREAGLAALRKLEFDPGYADGAPVAVWIPFTFTFEWQE